MLTDRGRRISVCNGTLEYSNRKFRGDNGYGFVDRSSPTSASKILRISSPTSSPPSSTSSATVTCSFSTGAGYIEHRVSKFDTLAGIAIKYGVEVADITKLNGLVTDLQMFALKSLRIPLPGRHPPSPCLSNGSLYHGEDCSEQASSSANNGNLQDVYESFQSLRLKPSETKISPAMSSLQGYYGLKPRNRRASEGLEMAVYNKEASHLQDDDQYLTPFPATNTPLNHHRKSRSLVDAVIAEVNQSSNPSKAGGEVNSDKPMRRRQKSEADFTSRAPEMLLKKENRSSNGAFSAIAGKGLALRTKAASRTNLSADTETSNSNPVPVNLMEAPVVGDSFSSVRKSFSASSLQEPDCNSNGPSLWPTSKWTLKADLLTQAALTSSIFDGLPKPLTGRRHKKAVD
ncbi:hypothetical protein EUTSA_v10004348mg [Eutrema salsugineum]|uniref:LysM domain-containing protein n=1 Tax=Eutrema salsugineum TaxID=72664 RepID=V4KPH6_EUTSA|nr:uncharacterized protein LOC18013454 [Eutrema salsugineum]ESQ31867.1 hypothetical protein EUTSA_v10004348mg [Eutrema salsugineum]